MKSRTVLIFSLALASALFACRRESPAKPAAHAGGHEQAPVKEMPGRLAALTHDIGKIGVPDDILVQGRGAQPGRAGSDRAAPGGETMESRETESEFRSKARTRARTAWAVAGFSVWLAHEESNVLAEFGEQHVRDAALAPGLHPTPRRFTTSEPKGDLS